jgi:hypothetical protein
VYSCGDDVLVVARWVRPHDPQVEALKSIKWRREGEKRSITNSSCNDKRSYQHSNPHRVLHLILPPNYLTPWEKAVLQKLAIV